MSHEDPIFRQVVKKNRDKVIKAKKLSAKLKAKKHGKQKEGK